MLMTFHDQTPLRRVEEMRADFVANASHELRTPLAALSGFIDTLQGRPGTMPRRAKRFLGIMHAQATRMARLIDDLLSLSRVELSAHVRPDTLVDIVPIIRQVADGLEPLARERAGGDRDRSAGDAGDDRRRSRGIAAAVREPDRERAEIQRLRRQGHRLAEPRRPQARAAPEFRVMVRDFGPGIAPGTPAAAHRDASTGSTSATAVRGWNRARFIAG